MKTIELARAVIKDSEIDPKYALSWMPTRVEKLFAEALAHALLEAEKVILNHSEGCESECDGDITEAKDWLEKYAGEK